MPAPPASLAFALFCLIPAAALAFCGTLVWRRHWSIAWKVCGLILTVLAMTLQVGALLVVLITAINAAISLPQ